MIKATAVIPARYGSTRFPGKPLANRTGKPLIQHVVEQVAQARTVSRIIVATDDQRIAEVVEAFGGCCRLTGADHPNGTSRIAEVVAQLASDSEPIILNVQGDEPQVPAAMIDQLVEHLAGDAQVPMATVASRFAAGEDPDDPNIVKVVVDQRSRALYFSRCPIPFARTPRGDGLLKHAGLYAYRRPFLLRYVQLRPTPAEQAEQLEQLRALEHGFPIAVAIWPGVCHHGIDTPEQYDAFVQRVAASPTGHRGD